MVTGASRKLAAMMYDKGGEIFNVMHPDFGAKCNGVDDDTVAIQAAIDNLGSTSSMRYGSILVPGYAIISGTLNFDRKVAKFFGNGRGGGLVWNGPNNIPMVKIKRSWMVSVHDMRFLNQHAVNKPSACIDINVTAGDSPSPTRFSLRHLTIGGDGFNPATQKGFKAGIITSGDNLQCDQSDIGDLSLSDCSDYGIKLNASQNVFWNIENATINAGLTAKGISTAAKHTTVRQVFSQTNGVDYELVGDARIVAENIGSEISGRFILATTAGQFICRGGYWQARSLNQAIDAQVIQMQGGAILDLENFEFTDNGSVATLPKMWLRGSYVSVRLKEVPLFPGQTWAGFLDQEPNGPGHYRIIDVSGPGGSYRNEYVFGEDRGDGIVATLDPLRYDMAPNVRVRQDPWIAPALQNAWANQGSGVATAGYYKDKDNVVHLKGGITGGATADGTLLFTLPAGYRPSGQQFFRVHGTANAIRIFVDGTVKLEGVSGASVYLDAIQFRVA